MLGYDPKGKFIHKQIFITFYKEDNERDIKNYLPKIQIIMPKKQIIPILL